MALQENIRVAYNALQEQAPNTKVLLLHPNSRYRTLLIAMMINDDSIPTYYYSLGPDDVNLRSFLERMSHEIANQHPTFGRHLNQLDPTIFDDIEDNVDEVVEKFVQELEEISDSPYFFVLDEYDRSDSADDIHRFVEKLADVMPENCRMILNSRSLPRLPWVSMVAKKQAALLQDDQLVENNFYSSYRGDDYRLEVFALGPSSVLNNGSTIDTWEGHLPRLLFFFALDKPLVTRSEICSAFWPDLQTDQAVNVFHVTKRRLHKAIGLDILVHIDNHYQINPEFNVYYDVLDFVETLMRGRNPNTEDSFAAWQHAVDLYRGPFLQGHSDVWIDERRFAFRTGYLEALSELANVYIDTDRKEMALKMYQQGLDEDYMRQDLHRSMMRLYADMGRRPEAVAHYQQMEKTFNEQKLGIEPETVELNGEIKASS